MATLVIGSTQKDALAERILGTTYSDSKSAQQAQIDDAVVRALNNVNRVAQWLTQTQPANTIGASATTLIDDSLIGWWNTEASLMLAKTYRLELVSGLQDCLERDRTLALQAYARSSLATTTINVAATLTLQSIRGYVISHCIRQERPLFPEVEIIDQKAYEVITELWNMTGWNFRRRQIKVKITVNTVSDATYTEATKNLNKSSGFANYTDASGTIIRITAGTGATTGFYHVSSKTDDDNIVLGESIGSAADGETDIDLEFIRIEVIGLESGETMDEVSAECLYYEDTTTVTGTQGLTNVFTLQWLDADAFAVSRAMTGRDPGRPRGFRLQSEAGTRGWLFDRWPDTTYKLYGEVFIKGATVWTGSTTATAMNKWPAEFRPFIREMVLARVLKSHGRSHDINLDARLDVLLSRFDDHGVVDDRVQISDVYGDYASISDVGTQRAGTTFSGFGDRM